MAKQVYRVDTPIIGKIHAYFERHGEAYAGAPDVAHAPAREHVAGLINAVFWASLVQVEGRPTTLSIAYLPPEQSQQPFVFARPLPLEPNALAKVAPSAERPGIHFGAWPNAAGELEVWGMTRSIPLLCFVLDVASPGLIVVKHRHGGQGSKFVNAAVLAGDEAKLVDGAGSRTLECSSLLNTLIGWRTTRGGAEWIDPTNVFVQLALSMRAHRRGGTMLVVPAAHDEWRTSIASPILYCAREPFGGLRDHARRAAEDGARRRHRAALGRVVDAIAGLTAVDGATIVTDALEVVGFGAKIVRRKGQPPVESVLLSEPVEGNRATKEAPSALGGTRHLSAAQFVNDQRDAVAMVASQDGRFTIFTWSQRDELVHAHRIDVLLM
jgi:hypothetical protein